MLRLKELIYEIYNHALKELFYIAVIAKEL